MIKLRNILKRFASNMYHSVDVNLTPFDTTISWSLRANGDRVVMPYVMRMRKKSGFTLIEILIATAIASILMASLFFSYGQMNKVFYFTRNYVDIYDTAILVQQQMQKDIAGVFIPVQAVPQKKETKKSEKMTEALKKDEKQQNEQKTKESPQQETPKKKLIKDPFLSKNVQDQMQLLTFITNNPMRVYVSAKSGQHKPSMVRVVYTLEKDPETPKDKPRFILYRQESTELQLAPYLKAESAIERYPLARNIVSCKLMFEALDQKENGNGKVVTFPDWRIGDDPKDLRTKVKLPTIVNVTLILTDDNESREQEFTFVCVLMAGFHTLPEVEAEKKSTATPPQQKGAAPNAQQPEGKKELLVSSANNIVNNIRGLFGA